MAEQMAAGHAQRIEEGGQCRGIVASAGLRHRQIDAVAVARRIPGDDPVRSEEHTSELQSLMRISYAVFRLKKNIPHKHVAIHMTPNTALTHTINYITMHQHTVTTT